jgi:hypothetical protein
MAATEAKRLPVRQAVYDFYNILKGLGVASAIL